MTTTVTGPVWPEYSLDLRKCQWRRRATYPCWSVAEEGSALCSMHAGHDDPQPVCFPYHGLGDEVTNLMEIGLSHREAVSFAQILDGGLAS